MANAEVERRGPSARRVPRRRVLQVLAAMGVGSATFRHALAGLAQEQAEVTSEMIKRAAWLSGVEFSEAERELMARGVNGHSRNYAALREIALDNGVAPALTFYPSPPAGGGVVVVSQRGMTRDATSKRPNSDEQLAFAPVTELAGLLRSRQISSVELTRLYLQRLRRYDAALECVITYCERTALQQAEKADREIAAGEHRGPLHGIPWGAKDLLAFPGYPTTWGARPYKDQVRDEKATVIERLEKAGAVLIAKLTVGALAWGDVWFGGKTKNPWNPEQGSSGSSAGPVAAAVGGLAGFTIGTETLGSIVSPCTRCGATGLRPTFGRVSRHGVMALSWSMDKVGPIARSVEDCALVFRAIHGADGRDHSAVDRPFDWPVRHKLREIKIGFVESLFDEQRLERIEDEQRRARARARLDRDRAVLEILRGLGATLTPIKLPDKHPVSPLRFILTAEAATAFDELTRSGRDDELVRQIDNAWPNVFRQGQLIPAVEYLRANRVRTLLMREMERVMSQVDVYVCPTFGGSNLLLTNLTGHPAVVLPNSFDQDRGPTSSITFTSRLYGEADLLAVAQAYQQATDFHLHHPAMDYSSAPGGQGG